MVHIGNAWDGLLSEEFTKPYYLALREFLKKEYATETVYPPMQDIFNALRHTDFPDVRVVILGQDPYHEPGQAHGLAFSVNRGVEIPPSLRNIYAELHSDLGVDVPNHGDLTAWAKNGVLLLNATLTVRRGAAASHKGQGWETLTDEIIKKMNDAPHPVAFLLWGRNARMKKAFITNPRHLILESVHPSPLSAYNGFFGSRPFSKINAFLERTGQSPIPWDAIKN